MFEIARIILTAWYLLIIMMISLLFSVGIYVSIDREYQRFERGFNQGRQMLHQFNQLNPPPHIPIFDEEIIEQSRARLIAFLLLTNGVIFVVSGSAGYFLAGRTLRPIREMVYKQNQFIQDASHELRTPLTSLRAEIEVALHTKNLRSAEQKLLTSNLEEVIRLQQLADRLLGLANNTSQVSHFSKINLKDILHKAIKRVDPLLKQKHISLSTSTQSATISGSEDRLVELFVILLDNAIKYSPKKSIITVRLKKQKRKVVITITDQGIGIGSADLVHIFDRFYRAKTNLPENTIKGFGLGLPIAQKIANEHQGTIDVESNISKGSSFSVTLPLTR